MTPNSWFFALLLLLSTPLTIFGDFGNSLSTATPFALNTLMTDDLPLGDTDYLVTKLLVGRSYRVTVESTQTSSYVLYSIQQLVVKTGTITTGSFSYVPTQTQDFYFVIVSGKSASYNFAIIDETPCSGSCTDCRTVAPICSTCVTGYQCTSCYNVPANFLYNYGGSCFCDSNEYYISENCIACSTLDINCVECHDANICKACSGSLLVYGKTCVVACPSGFYNNGNGACISCQTLDGSCSACNSSMTCTGCSLGLLAFGAACTPSCPSGTFNNNGVCTSCTTLDSNCAKCNDLSNCKACSGSLLVYGKTCVTTCPFGFYNNGNGACISCQTLDGSCSTCNSSTTCTGCSSGLLAFGVACTPSCPSGTFNNNGVCTSCTTLDSNCVKCNDVSNCQACSGSLLVYGNTCVTTCPPGSFNNNNGVCIVCTTLDNYCMKCSESGSCLGCSSGKVAYGAGCYDFCPFGTKNTNGICVVIPLTITLANTEEANIYLVQFSSPLTVDVQVPAVSKVTLVGVAASAYSITMTKQTDTIYQITIQYSQTILSTTLKIVYTLNGSPATTNVLRGQWTANTPSKYLAYMSEATKAAVEAVNKVAGAGIQGAASGAGSMAILGGNPALLWPLLNLFQAFYYLIFIDVNYPANVQMFLKIFSMGSLTFLPNPLNWFVGDIDAYDLPVPKRYNDYNFSGLFLDNAGNEILLVALTFGLYLVSKVCRKWIRKLPTLARLSTNKTVEWFEWSGILRSLITSYTDMAQAVFLQMRVLAFYSTVFTLSAFLAFLALGFVVLFPVLIFLIIRRFNDHPELLYIKYETLVGEYNIKKESSRNFIVIWLVRRLIMCLSLVFLQGFPYVQINILCILMLTSIFYSWCYTPYTTRKENVCNTLIEIFFGCIHGVIYILIYDDHNPYFSDDQRLQMGWVIIFACGIILMISVGLSLIEQVRVVIRGIRLLKQLLSKKEKPKKTHKEKLGGDRVISQQESQSSEHTILFDQERSELDTSINTTPAKARIKRVPITALNARKERRTRIAHRIRELRQINGNQ